MTFDEVQREYDLKPEDLKAALNYAAELVEEERHHPLPAGN
jgi:uncharacterized protein (DUF433 family)